MSWFIIIIGNIAAIDENKVIFNILFHGNKLSNDSDRISFAFVTCIRVFIEDDKIYNQIITEIKEFEEDVRIKSLILG